MPRRRISFDVAVNTPSAQREADRLATIFQNRLRNVQVGTQPGRGGAGGAGGGGGRSGSSGMPGSSIDNLFRGSFQFAIAGHFYKFFSDLPRNIIALEGLATANRRAAASFATLAGGAGEANAMIDAYIEGMGGAASRTEATTNSMRLFNIGMASNAQEMRVFTTLSRGMSQALGRETGYIQEQLALALANQSMLRFDQLGLSIERHQEIMEDLTAAHPELTKEMAFQNAMLTQAIEKYYNLATAQEALATNAEHLSTALQNQHSILAQIVGQTIIDPIAGTLARGFGSDAVNLGTGTLRNYASLARWRGSNPSIGGPEGGDAGGAFARASDALGQWLEDQARGLATMFDPVQQEINAATADALITALNTAQASINLGIEPNPEYVAFLHEVEAALTGGVPAAEHWRGQINAITDAMEMAAAGIDPLNSGLIELDTAGAAATARIEDITSALQGVAGSAVSKLIKEGGMHPNDAIEFVRSRGGADIEDTVRQWEEAGAFAGDPLGKAAAIAVLEMGLEKPADDFIEAGREAAREAEAAAKRAASEQERAAKAAEKAFISAADEIESTFDKMLTKIPGLFGKSEVTEEDLLLAEKGQPVNFADDYRRRVEDVAFNKKTRTDVDMGMVRAALGLPEDADDKVTAILFSRAWESGSLWQNPENIEKFLNVDAAKADLHAQEMAELGTRNLRAFFGLGTEQGNEMLKVFGVEALDPIQDGLITEITTRGPDMGRTLAESLFTGFEARSLELPWVASLMSAIDNAVGRALLGDLNSGAQGELAAAEAVP